MATTRNGRRNGRSGGPSQNIAQSLIGGDPEEGFAKQIYRLTGAGETVMDVMSRTILTPDEADIISDAWLRGVRIAQDPESPYDAERLVKDPISKFAGHIPVPILWLLGKCVSRLSSNGYNADRVMKMHVQPNILPSVGADRWDKLRGPVEAVRGDN